MMENIRNTNTLWAAALEAIEALGRQYDPAMHQVADEMGLSEGYGWLLAAMTFDPEPVSAARLGVRNPYASVRLFDARVIKAVELGFLTQAEEEAAFSLTESGRRAAGKIISTAYEKMATLQPVPPDELDRLANLLHRWVIACLEAPEPPGKWCILLSRRLDPGGKAPVIVRIDQYLSDLAAYRDDSHLAAWRIYTIEGRAWEAFTCLWREGANTLEGLYQKLIRHGFIQEEYRQALDDLIRRGWVSEHSGEYELTGPGRQIREESEQVTDRYFIAPLSCLSRGEIEEIRTLLGHLRDAFSSIG